MESNPVDLRRHCLVVLEDLLMECGISMILQTFGQLLIESGGGVGVVQLGEEVLELSDRDS